MLTHLSKKHADVVSDTAALASANGHTALSYMIRDCEANRTACAVPAVLRHYGRLASLPRPRPFGPDGQLTNQRADPGRVAAGTEWEVAASRWETLEWEGAR